MRNVIVEDRSWTADRADSNAKTDRRLSTDPVAAALVNYSYARV